MNRIWVCRRDQTYIWRSRVDARGCWQRLGCCVHEALPALFRIADARKLLVSLSFSTGAALCTFAAAAHPLESNTRAMSNLLLAPFAAPIILPHTLGL